MYINHTLTPKNTFNSEPLVNEKDLVRWLAQRVIGEMCEEKEVYRLPLELHQEIDKLRRQFQAIEEQLDVYVKNLALNYPVNVVSNKNSPSYAFKHYDYIGDYERQIESCQNQIADLTNYISQLQERIDKIKNA